MTRVAEGELADRRSDLVSGEVSSLRPDGPDLDATALDHWMAIDDLDRIVQAVAFDHIEPRQLDVVA